MIIVIGLKKFYDWEPHPEPDKITEDEKLARINVKLNHEDVWLRKVLADPPDGETHTTIALPEAEIQDYMKNNRFGRAMNRNQAIAHYLATVVMPEHGHPEHFAWIRVHDDRRTPEQIEKGEPHDPKNDPAKVEVFLKSYFEVTGDAPADA